MAGRDVAYEHVLAAIAEFDQLGRSAFLARYGFGEAPAYELVVDGRVYDSKAIFGAAHRYATGVPLTADGFSGGLKGAAGALRRLGFEVRRRPVEPDPGEVGTLDLRECLQRVLGFAAHYSSSVTAEMHERDRAVHACAAVVRGYLESLAEVPELRELSVRPGGRVAQYGPVPYVQIYSEAYAPSAGAGYHLAYLFAADGERVYLSLNQGTSEEQYGRIRPMTGADAMLHARAAQARAALDGLEEAGHSPRLEIDLGVLPRLGREARRRVENYENANIIAYEYGVDEIPSQEQLLADLAEMLPLLVRLYHPDPDLESPQLESPVEAKVRRALGRKSDPVVRRAVELYAEDRAERHFAEQDFVVERVGRFKLGYDLDCRHADGRVLHVEVKGSQTAAVQVILTPREVGHREECPGAAEHALYVVSSVDVGPDAVCSGGVERCVVPWVIDRTDLTPSQYSYRVPD